VYIWCIWCIWCIIVSIIVIHIYGETREACVGVCMCVCVVEELLCVCFGAPYGSLRGAGGGEAEDIEVIGVVSVYM
jgi:hypothetical protein